MPDMVERATAAQLGITAIRTALTTHLTNDLPKPSCAGAYVRQRQAKIQYNKERTNLMYAPTPEAHVVREALLATARMLDGRPWEGQASPSALERKVQKKVADFESRLKSTRK